MFLENSLEHLHERTLEEEVSPTCMLILILLELRASGLIANIAEEDQLQLACVSLAQRQHISAVAGK